MKDEKTPIEQFYNRLKHEFNVRTISMLDTINHEPTSLDNCQRRLKFVIERQLIADLAQALLAEHGRVFIKDK